MTRDLKQSTAVTIVVGPFVDTGGAAVTAPTIASIDITAYKNNGTPVTITPAASGTSNDMVHVDDGYYSLELTATDTATAGYLRLSFQVSGALIFHEDFNILPANVYNSRYTSGGGGESLVDETAADLIAARVNASRGDFYPNAKQVWVLKRDGAGLEVKNDFQITMGEGETLKVWIDFASVVGKNEFIQSIDSLELSGGSAVIVTDSSGILGNLVYLQVEGGIDGDATTVDFEVTTTAGQVITGSVCVFNVVK